MFKGGFDADIIIPSLKIAIHWNGDWHYKPVITDELFEKIKTRDIKRYAGIEASGYTNYIIRDIGSKQSKLKAEQEFIIFIKWLETRKLPSTE